MKARNGRALKRIVIAASAFAVLMIPVEILREAPKVRRYNEAIDLMNGGQLTEAKDRFIGMTDYRDALAYFYCCNVLQYAEREDYWNAKIYLNMIRKRCRLLPDKYPKKLNEALIAKIEAGYEACADEIIRRELARMALKSNTSGLAKQAPKSSHAPTWKRRTDAPSKEDDDPLDARSYSNPEDFYDDNYHDFFDYEEAEEYYNDHGGR